MRRRELQNEGVTSKLERKFNVKRKGVEVVHEKVRQRLVVVGEKYDNRTEQYQQIRLFESNQKRLFNELGPSSDEQRKHRLVEEDREQTGRADSTR